MTPSNSSVRQELTIAELLKLHRIPDDDPNDAMESFRDPAGKVRQLTKVDVIRFLENYGALQPGDYAEQEGSDWREHFYALAQG